MDLPRQIPLKKFEDSRAVASMKNILFIFGTRPEVIKIAPIVLACKALGSVKAVLCNTGQQRELSKQTLEFFNLKEDFDLDVMSHNQSLSLLQSLILSKLQEIVTNQKFDYIVIQGDTMSAFTGALVGFYNKIPVGHVEAGLRSHNLHHPFPEEALRQCISRISDMHFAPTNYSKIELIKENIKESKIYVTGNTVVDSLKFLSCVKNENFYQENNILINKKNVLITVHRRENHGKNLSFILNAIKKLAVQYTDHNFIIPVHPNPNVKGRIYKELKNYENVILTNPLDYPVLIKLMSECKLILTDSGGIQEEAPSFLCPVLVLRETTERVEGVDAGFAKLVGVDEEKIEEEAAKILEQSFENTRLKNLENPYGDGKSGNRILNLILKSMYE